MDRFLKERIVYISEKEIERVLKSFPNQAAKDRIRKLFIQQKFYSNNEFAFKEVHNERLFRENAKVLIEILQLLQYKQFRYDRKDSAEYKKQKRYLGEFFELLLDAGYKQTAGQFFTPLPIAKFIITSLPIREIIRTKIEQKQLDFLPLLIDYACGSGHFLVEAIEEIQEAIDELQPIYDDETNNRIRHWQETDWTKGFLFGIEKDYRLARTAKLACFMNGDGETNIILGDGLEDYSQTDPSFPRSFDALAANPPYSIKDFKSHTLKSLKHNNFDLMRYLSDTASEIEVLFVERLAQLLHANAVCGVILPKTILSNAGIYTKAREVLLRNFEIRAVVEFGPNTFMETTTNTVVLFLKRREARAAIDAEYVAEDFITYNRERENDFADTQNILAAYVRTLGFTPAEYKSFLSCRPADAVVNSDWYKDYRRWFENLAETKKLRNSKKFLAASEAEQAEVLEHRFFAEAKAREKDKFVFFFLAYGQKTLIVRAHSDKRREKHFIGYEFSKKRGFEGIKLYKQNGKHQTALYDDDDLQNPGKLNYMVRRMLVPELYDYQSANSIDPLPSTTALGKQGRIVDLTDCLDLSRIEFEKVINLSARGASVEPLPGGHPSGLTPLGDVCEVKSEKITPEDLTNDMAYVGLEHIESNTGRLLNTESALSVDLQSTKNVFQKGDVLYGKLRPYLNKVYLAEFDGICSTDILVLKSKHPKLLKYALLDEEFVRETSNIMKGISLPRLQVKDFLSLKVYFPKTDGAVERTVKEIEAVEKAEDPDRELIKKKREEISRKANELFFSYSLERLGKVCEPPQYGAAEKALMGDPEKDYRYIRITDVNGSGALTDKEFMTAENIEPKYVLQDGDFLFARSGYTAGKTFLYKERYGKAIYAGYFIRFRCSPNYLLPKFLDLVTKSENYQDWVLQTRGGSSQPNINAAQFSNYQIPLPSVEEQEKVIAEIEALENKIAEAEERLSKAAERKAEILRKYV
jgi:type I restriction enzyme M protein